MLKKCFMLMTVRGRGRPEANSPSLRTPHKCQDLGHVPRLTPTWKKEGGHLRASSFQIKPSQAETTPKEEGGG